MRILNKFEEALLSYIPADKLEKIQSYKIGIAGAGGLGSNCACSLVRSGFRDFVIADFDRVELSNLNRQFFFLDQEGEYKVDALESNLRRINPDISIHKIKEKVNEDNIGDFFKECSIVIEAFDKAVYKKMLLEKLSLTDKIIICVSGIAGTGNSDKIITRKINDKFYIIGDGISGVSKETPPLSPRVCIAAAKEADVVLDIVMNGFF
jgi:sulfur carrier protein ThiS adenylyltransferase